MTEASYFLTRDELAALCESRRHARQIEHLRRIGVPFHLTPSGRPMVTRAALDGPSIAEAKPEVSEDDRAFLQRHSPWELEPSPSTDLAWFAKNWGLFIRSRSEVLAGAKPQAETSDWGAGVYFLVYDGSVQYIGKTHDWPQRLASHAAAGRVREWVYTLDCPASLAERVEECYLHALRPPENVRFRAVTDAPDLALIGAIRDGWAT